MDNTLPKRGDVVLIHYTGGTARWRVCTGNVVDSWSKFSGSGVSLYARFLGTTDPNDAEYKLGSRHIIHLWEHMPNDPNWEFAEDKFVRFVKEVLHGSKVG